MLLEEQTTALSWKDFIDTGSHSSTSSMRSVVSSPARKARPSYDVKLTVHNLRGVLVHSSSSRRHLSSPHEMHALITVMHQSVRHGRTSLSSPLLTTEAHQLEVTISGSRNSTEVCTARWDDTSADDDGHSKAIYFSAPLATVENASAGLHMENVFQLIVSLTDASGERFVVPLGVADIALSSKGGITSHHDVPIRPFGGDHSLELQTHRNRHRCSPGDMYALDPYATLCVEWQVVSQNQQKKSLSGTRTPMRVPSLHRLPSPFRRNSKQRPPLTRLNSMGKMFQKRNESPVTTPRRRQRIRRLSLESRSSPRSPPEIPRDTSTFEPYAVTDYEAIEFIEAPVAPPHRGEQATTAVNDKVDDQAKKNGQGNERTEDLGSSPGLGKKMTRRRFRRILRHRHVENAKELALVNTPPSPSSPPKVSKVASHDSFLPAESDFASTSSSRKFPITSLSVTSSFFTQKINNRSKNRSKHNSSGGSPASSNRKKWSFIDAIDADGPDTNSQIGTNNNPESHTSSDDSSGTDSDTLPVTEVVIGERTLPTKRMTKTKTARKRVIKQVKKPNLSPRAVLNSRFNCTAIDDESLVSGLTNDPTLIKRYKRQVRRQTPYYKSSLFNLMWNCDLTTVCADLHRTACFDDEENERSKQRNKRFFVVNNEDEEVVISVVPQPSELLLGSVNTPSTTSSSENSLLDITVPFAKQRQASFQH